MCTRFTRLRAALAASADRVGFEYADQQQETEPMAIRPVADLAATRAGVAAADGIGEPQLNALALGVETI